MNGVSRMLKVLTVVLALAIVGPAMSGVSAQDGEGFPLGTASAFCEPGYLGPFEGCTPWEGVEIFFASADGTFATSCVTSGTDRAAGCGVEVPFGSTIEASIDPSIIPAGYVLEGPVSQEFVIPAGPPEGVFGGPVFVLLPDANAQVDEPSAEEAVVVAQDEAGFPLGASSAYCEPGYSGPFVGCAPWEGVAVSFESVDGSFSTSCVTFGAVRAAGCGVEVPFGSTIIASIDPGIIPAGWMLEGMATQEFTIPDAPPDGIFGGPAFVLLPAGEDAPVAPDQVASVPAGFPAGFYVATCDDVALNGAAVELDFARLPEGELQGMAGGIPVATGFTTVDVPFDTLLDGSHVLVIFDSVDPDLAVACGPVGGALDSNGALTIGLAPLDNSGVIGVAYIGAQGDGEATGVSLFVMDEDDAGVPPSG